MNWKKVVLGASALLVLLAFTGYALADGFGGFRRGIGHTGGFSPEAKAELMEELGLLENASREEVMQARWQKHLKDLGLTEEDTIGEYREAVQARVRERIQELGDEAGAGGCPRRMGSGFRGVGWR